MILILVLVVVMLMSFAVYSFSNLMLVEYQATTTGLRQIQRRELAESGIDLAIVSMKQQRLRSQGLSVSGISSGGIGNGNLSSSRSQNCFAEPVMILMGDRDVGAISVLQDIPAKGQLPVFGLLDESAKLNLNSLPLELSRRKESRGRLMELPGVTIQLADCILDWLDSDDDASEFGAESSWYSSQSPPRQPRQGPLQSLDELLQIRGMTAELLYGEDQNRNQLLDASEDDGNATFPADNRDGRLDGGLWQYLTLSGSESTRNSDGARRININNPHLDELFDQTAAALDIEAATYIVAWRMFGATFLDAPRPDEGEDLERRRLERLESARRRLQSQLGQSAGAGNGGSRGSGSATRGGMNLSAKPPFQFQSLVDLFGGQVRATIDSQDRILQSPWPSDPASLRRLLPALQALFCTSQEDTVAGRININQASLPVLKSIPGIDESLARSIQNARPASGASLSASGEYSSIAWLVSRGIINTGALRQIAPFITTQGSVHSGVAVGQTVGDRPVAAIRFQFGIHGDTHQILQFQDLPVLPCTAIGLPLVKR